MGRTARRAKACAQAERFGRVGTIARGGDASQPQDMSLWLAMRVADGISNSEDIASGDAASSSKS